MRDAPGASEQTRARVRDVAGQLGYRPDAGPASWRARRRDCLGIVYRVDALHHVDLLAPIYETAEAAGYELILSGRTRLHDEKHAVNTLLDYRCDALVMLGPDLSQADISRVALSVPVILAGRRMVRPSINVDSVRTDENAGTRMAIEHLASLGHRLIAHVDGGPNTISADRRRGYEAAMTRLGLRDSLQVFKGDGLGTGGELAGEAIGRLEARPDRHRRLQRRDRLGGHALDLAGGSQGARRHLGRRLRRQPPCPAGARGAHDDPPGHGEHRPATASCRAIERLERPTEAPSDEVFVPSFVPGETTGPAPEI